MWLSLTSTYLHVWILPLASGQLCSCPGFEDRRQMMTGQPHVVSGIAFVTHTTPQPFPPMVCGPLLFKACSAYTPGVSCSFTPSRPSDHRIARQVWCSPTASAWQTWRRCHSSAFNRSHYRRSVQLLHGNWRWRWRRKGAGLNFSEIASAQRIRVL